MEKGASSTANGSGDSLNGLKFGKKIYFEDVGGGGSSSKSMAAVGKKGKAIAAVGLGQQKAPRCQVEGCNLDLTGVKAYYCRHKVCGVHSKSPRVIVAGLEQRFCQQCSRFHLLSEFDQGKRSCRRRLAGHNERRRKPPPGPLTSRCGRLSSSFHEDNSRYRSFLMDFAYPRSLGSSKDIWPAMRNNDHPANNQWHGSFDTRVGVVANNQYPTFLSAPEQQSGDCLAGVSDSSCALSLLSTTQPWGAAIAASARPRNHEAPLILASTRIDGGPMAQLNIASSYMNSPWAFRDHSLGSNSLDMGHRQLLDTGNGHFSSELELALQDNRQCPDELGHRDAYDHDHSAMHWSL